MQTHRVYSVQTHRANAPSVVSAIPNMWLLPPHQGGNCSSQYMNLQDRPSTARRGRQGVVEKSLICDIEIKGQAPPLTRPLPFFALALGPTPLLQDWRSCSTHNPPCRIFKITGRTGETRCHERDEQGVQDHGRGPDQCSTMGKGSRLCSRNSPSRSSYPALPTHSALSTPLARSKIK